MQASLAAAANSSRPQRRVPRVWWCLLCCLLSLPVWALDPDKPFRQYIHDRWSIEDGLPQLSVLAITQDATGYLWLTTQNGVARFDGNDGSRSCRPDNGCFGTRSRNHNGNAKRNGANACHEFQLYLYRTGSVCADTHL